MASRVGHHDFHYVIHARNSRWPPRSRPIAASLAAAITNGGRACALAGVSATRSFLLSPTDASSALNAELTPSFENSSIARFSFTIFSRNVRGISMTDLSFFPWMLYEFRRFSILPRFALFQLFSRMRLAFVLETAPVIPIRGNSTDLFALELPIVNTNLFLPKCTGL